MKKNLIIMFMITICVVLLSVQGFAQKIQINYLTPETDPTTVEVDTNIIKKFEEMHPDVEITLNHATLEDVLPKLAAQLRAGTAPDVAFFSPRLVPGLVEEGFLLPLGDLFEEIGDIPDRFVTPTLDNKIYDIPILTESQVLYFRKDLFEDAGVKPPTNFNEWLEAAKTLTNDDQYGISVLGGMPENYFVFSSILWANGGNLFDEDNNVVIDSLEAVEALEFWGELLKYAPPGAINARWPEVQTQFSKGVSAMVRSPGRLLSYINKYNPELSSKIDIVPTPVGPSGQQPVVHACINCFVVFSGTKHPDIVKEFIKFYMTGDQYLEFLTASVPGHALPVRSAWLDNPKYFEFPEINRHQVIIKKSMEYAYEYGTDYHFRQDTVNPYLGEALSMPTFSNELNKFFNGDVTAEQALKNIANEWRKRFGID